MEKLTDEEIATRFAGLNDWSLREGRLEKDFEFADFRAALAFVNRVAVTAEALNHHPDWSNSYNKVHISLTSHEVAGLTKNDFSLALAADEAAGV